MITPKFLHNLFKLAPVCINAELGDPFQPTQWEGTRRRLLELVYTHHIGPVALITKSIVSDEQIEWLNTYTKELHLIVFFSVTGLEERYPLGQTLKGLENFSIKSISAKPSVFVRPIIPGKNDNIELLRPIVEAAAYHSEEGTIVFREYKDIETENFQSTVINPKFVESFKELCAEYDATIIGRTRDLPMYLGWPSLFAWPALSDEDANKFLSMVGFDDVLEAKNRSIEGKGNYNGFSKGDLHFVEMFTKLGVNPLIPRNKIKERMSRPVFGHFLDATSSWLEWGENKPCTIGCKYCIADANPEQKKYKLFGTNPDTIVLRAGFSWFRNQKRRV